MPYRLYMKDTDRVLSDLTEAQVEELIDLLVEEDSEDRDYYIDHDVLSYLEEAGAGPELLAALRAHVPEEGEGIEIEWREV